MDMKSNGNENEIEDKLLLKANIAEGIFSVLNNLIKYGCLVFLFRYGYLSIQALAGQETNSKIILQLLSDLKINQYLSYVIGGGGFAYGYAQRRLKKQTIIKLHDRIEKLEKGLDPKRSSSMLTTDGDTRPEDK